MKKHRNYSDAFFIFNNQFLIPPDCADFTAFIKPENLILNLICEISGKSLISRRFCRYR